MANGVRVLGTAQLADLDDPRGPLWPMIVALCVAAQLALLISHHDIVRPARPRPLTREFEIEDANGERRPEAA